MRRRAFLAALGGAAASPMIRPFAARAQQMPVIGILLLSNAAAAKDLALVTELSRLGYVEGRNIAFDIRAAGGDLSRLPALGRELAAARPKVLVGSATTSAEALALATHDIPIVMAVVGDPITAGLTTSMAQPTRNVTGFTMSSSSLAAKRLELLSEMVPNLRKVAYVTPDSPMSGSFRAEVQRAADKLGRGLRAR
jgi:putative tryptophan/tyrosine transport system substrate-binding protein